MAVRVRLVALATIVALVERQEARRRSIEPRRHVDFVVAHREMDERAAREGEQRFGILALGPRQPVEAILIDGVFNALGEVGLQFDGRNRQAVEEQHEVESSSRWLSSSEPAARRAAGWRRSVRGCRRSSPTRA